MRTWWGGPALCKFCFSSNFLIFMYILSIKKFDSFRWQHFFVLLCTCDVSIQPELLLEPIPNYWAPEVINVLELGHWQYIFTCLVETLDRKVHCYHVNDCSSKTLVIKGGVHFLRHCWPFITELKFANKRTVQKCRPPFTNKIFC